jgi:hypothetical protein
VVEVGLPGVVGQAVRPGRVDESWGDCVDADGRELGGEGLDERFDGPVDGRDAGGAGHARASGDRAEQSDRPGGGQVRQDCLDGGDVAPELRVERAAEHPEVEVAADGPDSQLGARVLLGDSPIWPPASSLTMSRWPR